MLYFSSKSGERNMILYGLVLISLVEINQEIRCRQYIIQLIDLLDRHGADKTQSMRDGEP